VSCIGIHMPSAYDGPTSSVGPARAVLWITANGPLGPP
jgi:hypothetical protein